jgi:hypothetical protein
MNEYEPQDDLSSSNVRFIVTLVFVVLLLFGPVEPYGLVFRLAYLLVIPTVLWFVLRFVSDWLNVDELQNERINRALWAGLAGAFIVGAYQRYTAAYHTQCERWIESGGERECIGDTVVVSGGDTVGAFLLIAFAIGAAWAATRRRIN